MMNVHSDVTYPCDLCGQKFNSKYYLKSHKKAHSKKATNCPDCGKYVKQLAMHLKRGCAMNATERKRFTCDLCETTFAHKHGLKRHIKQVHQKIMDFSCNLCEFRCNNSNSLR